MDKLVRVRDIAEMFDISEDRVYSLARKKLIPSVRVGRSLRFSLKAIRQFIDNGGQQDSVH